MRRIRTESFNNKCICVQYLLCCLMVLLTILNQTKIYSALFMVSFIVVLAMLSFNMDKYTASEFGLLVVVVIVPFINVCINGFANIDKSNISFNYFKKCIMYCTAIIYISLCSKICLNMQTRKFFKILTIILSCSIILLFFIKGNELYIYNGRKSEYLVFNFGNPNAAGIYLTAVALTALSVVSYINGVIKKTIVIVIGLFLCYLVTLTQCRNAEIVIVAFFIVKLFYRFKKQFAKQKVFPRWVIICVVFAPILFAVIYMSLIDNEAIVAALKFLSSKGKGIDSREEIWSAAFSAFGNSPIFGAYSEISGGEGMSQMHNSHVDVLTSYGVLPFFLMLFYFSKILLHVNSEIKLSMQINFFTAFICIILIGCCEAVLFSGGILYIFAGCFLANIKQSNKDIQAVSGICGKELTMKLCFQK